MRGRNIVFWLVAMLVCSFVWAASGSAASTKFVARVNGEGIKKEILDTAMSNFIENQKMFGREVKEEDKAKIRKDLLENMISAELLYQESKKAGLGDLSKEADQQFENIKKGFNSNEEFVKVLKEKGITEKDLKAQIQYGISIENFLDKKVYNNITVDEAEKKAEYESNKDKLNAPEQVKASHILKLVKEDASDEDKKAAREEIDELRKKAVSGEDFAELAKANSEDGSAVRGGDLGYFSRGQMVRPFEDAAFSMEIGDISPVVETQFGYHVIKLTDKKPAHLMIYDEVEKNIEAFLMDKHKKEKIDSLVNDLRKKAKIEIY
ncbi:MAG: peptidylprolyl isomerase [Candidatus Omnitrophota bacterium]